MTAQRLQRIYDDTARGCFNFFLLFVLVNVIALWLAPRLEKSIPSRPVSMPVATGHDYTPSTPKDGDAGRPQTSQRRDWESLQWVDMRALRDLPAATADAVLDEFGDFGHRGYQFEPYVGFAPYPCTGTALNVDGSEDEFPYRKSVPPKGMSGSGKPLVVYTFGGSTTFGIYVPDAGTWTSNLWDSLQQKAHTLGTTGPVQVTNYGRPYYFSTQEVALLARLLKTGHRPDVVVFMDGLNDCFMPFWETHPDVPMFTAKMADWIHRAQFGQDWLVQFHWVPVVRLAFALHQKIYPQPSESGSPPTTDDVADRIVNGYRENVRVARSLCQTYGVQPYFFWQPCPFYHFDTSLQRRTFLIPPPMWEVFNKTYARIQHEVPGTVFLGDTLARFGSPAPAFVDNFHYSPAFAHYLAQRVAERMNWSP